MYKILIVVVGMIFLHLITLGLWKLRENLDRRNIIVIVFTFILVLTLFFYIAIESIMHSLQVPFSWFQFILTISIIIAFTCGVGFTVKKFIKKTTRDKRVKTYLERLFLSGILIAVILLKFSIEFFNSALLQEGVKPFSYLTKSFL